MSVAYWLNQFYLQKSIRRGQIGRCRSDGIIKTGLKYGLNWLTIQILRRQSGRGVALTTHPHLAPRLRETLEVHLYAHFGPSRPVLGCTLQDTDRWRHQWQVGSLSTNWAIFGFSSTVHAVSVANPKNDVNIEFMTIADLRLVCRLFEFRIRYSLYQISSKSYQIHQVNIIIEPWKTLLRLPSPFLPFTLRL